MSRNTGISKRGYCRLLPGHSSSDPFGRVREDCRSHTGPSVVDARHSNFQFYSSCVYYEPNCSVTPGNQALILVGYGTDPVEGDYWILKSSWGTTWAEKIQKTKNKNRKTNRITMEFRQWRQHLHIPR
ncbi:hypothetical protein L596_000421 [Steinernema carpocapsae]|uniref:Peptidase C1A papain C-terminal domain-containing protein n=1 Tax=Steinernema carpocapsae TaxID=34508 RepID=A0A4U8UI44_STECR|nr:hypothetical protein L596_000421 [Steinernema carpocapsae]